MNLGSCICDQAQPSFANYKQYPINMKETSSIERKQEHVVLCVHDLVHKSHEEYLPFVQV